MIRPRTGVWIAAGAWLACAAAASGQTSTRAHEAAGVQESDANRQRAAVSDSTETAATASAPTAPATATTASVPPVSSAGASDPWPLWPRAVLDEPLVTDRPDFTESTDAVPFGHFQLEMGYTFTYDRERDERSRSHTAPEFLLRAGLIEDLELRIGWEGYAFTEELFSVETRRGRQVAREDASQGAADLSLGFKRKFFEQDGLRPHFGAIVAMNVPSGSAGVSSGDVEPEVVLAWAYDLSDALSIAGNVGLAAASDEGERFLQTFASLSGAVALSDDVGAYVEYFGFYPNAEHADAAHSANGGLTYLIHDNLQLDLRAGFGLNEEADDFFAGIGFAWRW